VFGRLRADGDAELEVVSTYPWDGPARFRRWTIEEEVSVFARFDVGIMPLPDTPYTRAKAGFKLLQYMAAGLPVVASPIGINRDLVEQSGGGLLAATSAEWEEALRLLCGDPGLRARLGRKGRHFVERYADLDGQAATIARLLSTR
jgi:glycosyltransferase involved in cell wall biosynthesis